MMLRFYLLAGLATHKLVWEVLKRRAGGAADPAAHVSWLVRSAKGVKALILIGVIAQTLAPEVLPLAAEPGAVRALGLGIYTLGLGLSVGARVQLGSNWSDIEAPRVLRHQQVVGTGIYRFIRHPIYVGDLLLLLGLELSLNSWLVLGVALLAPFVVHRALREERMLAAALPEYVAYCARTKRFVPYIV